MREAFANQLAEIERRLEDELDDALGTLDRISHAVADPSSERAAAITDGARRLRAVSKGIEADMVVVTARQAPVAGDLRVVLAMFQLAHHGALIANQFELISEQLRELSPDVDDRQGTAGKLVTMTGLAREQLRHAVATFAARDLRGAAEIDREDDTIDLLNRQIFAVTNELGGAPDQRELALRHVLIARSLERIGDNAVDIAEQVAFLVTAELREFSDASAPRQPRDRP